MGNIKIDDLSKAVERELALYRDEINDAIEEEGRKAAREGARSLKTNSPKNTGAYAKSWGVRREKHIGRPDVFIIRNSKHYQLTHLLEYGHASRNGGRVKAYPHIAKVEKKVIKDFISKIESVIKGGG